MSNAPFQIFFWLWLGLYLSGKSYKWALERGESKKVANIRKYATEGLTWLYFAWWFLTYDLPNI